VKKEINIVAFYRASEIEGLSNEQKNAWLYFKTMDGLFFVQYEENRFGFLPPEGIAKLSTDSTFPWNVDNLAAAYLVSRELWKKAPGYGTLLFSEIDNVKFIDATASRVDLGWPWHVGLDHHILQFDGAKALQRMAEADQGASD